MRRLAQLLALAGFLVAVTGGPASAHASLAASNPASGAILGQAPSHIRASFTESPDPKLSFLEVLDSTGHPVDHTPVQLLGPRTLQVSVSPLPRGTYTVSWQTASGVDGHTVRGRFTFGVGVAPTPVPATTQPASSIAVATIAGRLLFYVAVLVLLGAAATGLVVVNELPGPAGTVLAAAGFAAVVGVTVMSLGMASEASVGLAQLVSSTVGHWLILRMVAALVVGAAVILVRQYPQRRWPLAILGAATAALVAVHTLAGHAAAPSSLRPLQLGSQSVHVLAVGAWIGGLGWLWVSLSRRTHADQTTATRRFSTLAATALAVVATTGLVRAWAEVGSLSQLLTSPYGRWLSAKVAVVAALAALGGLNRFLLVPRLVAGGTGHPLRRAVTGELALAGVALAVTAVLSALPPPATARPLAQPQAVAAGHDVATTVKVQLAVTPAVSGLNQLQLQLADFDNGPTPTATAVRLSLAPTTGTDTSSTAVALHPDAAGRWQATTTALSLPGAWTVRAELTSPQGNQISVPLGRVDIRPATAPS